MRLSRQVQYAICGVFDIAYNGRADPVQIRVISERQAIPGRYLEQIFQRLRRAGIVRSKRGPGGGYSLARPPGRISLREIIEAVEGPVVDAMQMKPGAEGEPTPHRPDFLWAQLAGQLGAVLDEMSIELLCGAAVRAEVERADAEPPMYFI